jgi:uncharacterized membrane protein
MVWLILGLILFIGAHLLPTFTGLKKAVIARLGDKGFKGVVTAPSLAGLALIIYGSVALRGAPENTLLWTPPAWGVTLAYALMFVSFVMFAAANFPSKIRDAVKHPQVTALGVWALAHLFANGDLLSLLLFGAFLLFSIYDRISLARRNEQLKAPANGFGGDIKAIIGGGVLWAATVFWLHGWAGAPLL